METNEYILFLKRFVEQVWQRGNLATIGKYVSPDSVYHDITLPDTLVGPDALADYIFHFRSALQDWHFQVEDVIGEANKIAVRWVVQGTHQAQLGQLPPSGHPVLLTGMTLYHLQANTIIEAWNCWNQMSLAKQLRTVFCACGMRLVALDDTALAQAYQHHVDAVHQGDQYSITEEQIRSLIAANAHEFTVQLQEPDLARAYGSI